MKRDKRKPGRSPLEAPRKQAPSRRLEWRHALAGVVVLLALLAYSNSFRAPFLLDNAETILQDTRVHAATPENVHRILGGGYYQAVVSGLYRPLTTLTYLYNYAVLGDGANPAGYHWFNFLLHAVNIALVYALGLILFEQIPAALALAALWGLHPVLTEGVTNIVGRADMLAAFGVLAGVVCYHRLLRNRGALRAAWIAAIAAATAAGMFSKESGIVAIAAVALYDWAFATAKPWRARLAGYAAVAIPTVVFLIVRARVLASLPAGPDEFTDNPLLGAAFWTGRMTAVKVIGKYLGLLVWPAKLAPDYSYNEIPVSVDAAAVFALLVCLAAVALAIWAWRRNRPLFFSIAFFFAALAPVSNIFRLIGSIMGERFLYLPAVGFMAAVVCGLQAVWNRAPRYRNALTAMVAVVAIALASRAYARNRDWLDERQFWRAAVEAAPGSYKPRIAAAGVTPRTRPEDWQHMVAEVERSLAIVNPLPDDRNTVYPYRLAGALYRAYGDEAAAHGTGGQPAAFWYRKSLQTLLRGERIERKLDETYRAVNARRGAQQATYLPSAIYRELGITCLRLSDPVSAVQALERGRSLESDPDLLENLAVAYGALGDLRRGTLALVEELAVDSSRTYLAAKLVDAYKALDPQGCAVKEEGGSPTLNVECPLVHDDICAASRNVAQNYARRNQLPEAASIRRVAVEDLGCAASAVN